MMNGYEDSQFRPDRITVDYLYVLRKDRDSGKLIKCYEPLPLNDNVKAKLEMLSQSVWDTLVANAKRFLERLPIDDFERVVESNHELKFCRGLRGIWIWWRKVADIRDEVETLGNCPRCFDERVQEKHVDVFIEKWQLPPIPTTEQVEQLIRAHYKENARYIREGADTFCQKMLSAFSQLVSLAEQACKERRVFLDACNRAFGNYLAAIEFATPGITEERKHCRILNGVFAEAELNKARDLTNLQIIAEPGEYYLAQVLEGEYRRLDVDSAVIAYSTRIRGRNMFSSLVDADGQLSIEVRTNFGYGRSTYHFLRILFHGIPVINAYNLILYRNINYAEVLDATKVFGHEESCLKDCIDSMAEYLAQYNELGPAGFAKKYVFDQIEELAKLLSAVCSKTAFFEVDDPKFLTKLSNCDMNLLFTDVGADSGRERLSSDDFHRLNKFVSEYNPNWEKIFVLANFRVDDVTDRGNAALFVRNFIKAKAANAYLMERLIARGIDTLIAAEVANAAVPLPENIHFDRLTGYSLIKARIRRASNVYQQLSNIEAVMRYSDDKRCLQSIKSSLRNIAMQAERYCKDVVAPEKKLLAEKVDALSEKLREAKAIVEALCNRATGQNESNPALSDARNKVALLAKEHGELLDKLAELDSRESYLRGVSSKILAKVNR